MIATLVNFIKQDGRRFAWEIGLAIGLAGISWAVGYLLNNRTLQSCQDERAALLNESKSAQAYKDSVYYSIQLKAKDQFIQSKEDENQKLREKMALDSADRMSLMDAIRSINARYKFKNG